jgi:hypothetical protein
MDEGIVVEVPNSFPLYTSPVHIVPKKDGWQKVWDGRVVNLEQVDIHFRMEGPEVVQYLVQPGDLDDVDRSQISVQSRPSPSIDDAISMLCLRGQVVRVRSDAVWFQARAPDIYRNARIRYSVYPLTLGHSDSSIYGRPLADAPGQEQGGAVHTADRGLSAVFGLYPVLAEVSIFALTAD